MQYSDLVTALSELLVISPTNSDFLAILPTALIDAEERIYRELDLVSSKTRNSANALTAGSRNLTLSVGTFVTVTAINVITPAGTTNPELGTRSPCVAASWSVLDAMYGSPTTTGVPKYYSLQDSSTIAFGPWPNAAYTVEILGTLRPLIMNGTSVTTDFISTQLPDLLVAACMVFLAGWQQNFGQQSDNPQLAMSWEQHYSTLKSSAQTEEARKHAMASLTS